MGALPLPPSIPTTSTPVRSNSTFYLPNGNRIDIADMNPNGVAANEVLDRGDIIYINNVPYELEELTQAPQHEISHLNPEARTAYIRPGDRAAWNYFMGILRVDPNGMNLGFARWVHRSREEARYRMENPRPNEPSQVPQLIAFSNEYPGFGTVTQADLVSLATYLPPTPGRGPLWSAYECMLNAGMRDCQEGTP